MHKELIANLKDWASDADAHRKQMVPVHRDTLRRIAAALAVPAQEQPISKTDADYWLSIRPGLIDALAARGLQIVSNKDGVRVVEHQQAGAAEVSDEMISRALAAACFYDTKESRKDMRNALEAALKAGGVA